jgi:hypothetical protein
MPALQRVYARVALVLFVLAVLILAPFAHPLRAQQTAPGPQVGRWELADVADWRAGNTADLLITNNAGGELRLAEEAAQGVFLSAPFPTTFAPNAVGAVWSADLPPGTDLTLEVRARADPPSAGADAGWGPWLALESADARSQVDDGAFATADVVAVPTNTAYLQLRAIFATTAARTSAVLDAVTVSYFRTASEPPVFAAGLPRRPVLFGPATLTPRPAVIPRETWSGRVVAAQPGRRSPRGIIVHQIAAAPNAENSLTLVRALLLHQTDVLGWDDLSYHFVIDPEGNLFEGRLGGPTSEVGRLSGGDTAVHVALIAPDDQAPSEQAQGVLITLLAWLGQAYAIELTGEHRVTVGDIRTTRPSVAGHFEVEPGANDPFPAFRALLPQLRTRADQSTVRARWYFAEGNVADYSQRLSFFNPAPTPADARVTLIRPGGNPVTQVVPVPAGARADLVVNDLAVGASALPAIIESSAPILAERSMGLTTDVDNSSGIAQLSRVWYFAEGSTSDGANTYLILFNPQAAAVAATLSYMRRDGVVFDQPVVIPGQNRLVITVNDIPPLPDGSRPLLNADFGVRVIAAQPIAAERTMRFGGNLTGFHTGKGITTLSRSWHFAEGTTEGDFAMRLLVLNPNDQPTNVEAIFSDPAGEALTRRYAVPPRSQLAILVNDVVPEQGVSTLVRADRAIAVERTLTFNDGLAGTVGPGAIAPSYRWAFVDGRTTDVAYYMAVSNPNRVPATVTVDLLFADGAPATQSFSIPPNARYTLAVHELYPGEAAVTAVVSANLPIVAERSLFPGAGTRGGSTALGFPLR